MLLHTTGGEPGETNHHEQPGRIHGENTEDTVPDEGSIFYDIRFSAYLPDEDTPMKLLINVEAQKDFYVGYAFVTRGVFYGARMISAQLDTEFTANDYSKLKKVYSIWICMNAPDHIGNAVSKYSIYKEDIIDGIPDIKKDYDKLAIVVVCLNQKKYFENSTKGLTGFLNTLFATDMDSTTKEQILSEDYGITINNNISEEMKHMCNLGEGVWERGVERGMERGMERGELLKVVSLIRSKLTKGKSPEAISDALEEDIDFINNIVHIISENSTTSDIDIVEHLLSQS